MSWISSKTGRYCGHPDEARDQLLHDGHHYEECRDCGKQWFFGRLSDVQVAVFQTAIDMGRSWKTAMEKATSFERRNVTVPFKRGGSTESESARTPLRERPR